MKYLVSKETVIDFWSGETKSEPICIVDTEEKAIAEVQKLSKSKYTDDDDVEFCFEIFPDNSDEYLQNAKKSYYNNLLSDIETLKNDIEVDKNALKQLKKIRNVFKPFHLEQYTSENVKDIFPELHKAIMENDLPVNLFDGKYDYNIKGKTEWSGRERTTYDIMTLSISTSHYLGYRYFGRNGYDIDGYDIDDDIKKLRKNIRSDKKELKNKIKKSEE